MSAFFQKTRKRSCDLFSGYSYYLPGIGGTIVLILLLLAGSLMGSAVVALFQMFFPAEDATAYGELLAYPVMFIPPMAYASYKSRRNELFDTGYALDSNNFGRAGGWLMAIMVSVATLAAGFLMDPVNAVMPPMPEYLEQLLKELVSDCPVWVSLLSVSVMAPFFEEWLCRGMILRGLLHRIRPVWAMVISALCFALIHFNPWQGIPAFVLGMLFAYVYYKTGSLKLTMLMHCVNNTFAVIAGQMDSLKDVDFYFQIMEKWQYVSLLAASLIIIVIFVDIVWKNIPMQSRKGNMDETSAAGMLGNGMDN